MFARKLINRASSAQGIGNATPGSPGGQLPNSPSFSGAALFDQAPDSLDPSFSTSDNGSSGSASSVSLRRRQRESLDGGDAEVVDDRRARARTQMLKQYAAEGARQRMLPYEEIEDFAALPTECMLIDLKLDLLVYNRKELSARNIAMVEAGTTRTLVRNKMHAILANPDVPQYVTGVKNMVMDVLRLKPALVGLTVACLKDAAAFAKLTTIVETALSNRRSEWRRQLERDRALRTAADQEAGPADGLFIISFTSSFLPRGTIPSAAQLARFAFLRDCYDAFMLQLNPDDGTTEDEEDEPVQDSADPHFSGNQFWLFVDFQLSTMRKTITSAAPTREAREQLLCSTFTSILQAHLQKYVPTDAEAGHGTIGRVTAAPQLDWEDVITTACA